MSGVLHYQPAHAWLRWMPEDLEQARTRAAAADAVQRLQDAGAIALEVHRPVGSAHTHRVYMHVLRAATGAMLDDASYTHEQHLTRTSDPTLDTARERTWRGSTLTHRDWVHFDQQRAVLRAQWQTYFQDVGLLITPMATSPAFAHNQTGERWKRMIPVNGTLQPSTDSLFWAGYPGVVGLPVTEVPLGLTPSGLPVGAQIIGDNFNDPLCLDMAHWLENAWRGFTPPPHLA